VEEEVIEEKEKGMFIFVPRKVFACIHSFIPAFACPLNIDC
jgi:hypothetical protein